MPRTMPAFDLPQYLRITHAMAYGWCPVTGSVTPHPLELKEARATPKDSGLVFRFEFNPMDLLVPSGADGVLVADTQRLAAVLLAGNWVVPLVSESHDWRITITVEPAGHVWQAKKAVADAPSIQDLAQAILAGFASGRSIFTVEAEITGASFSGVCWDSHTRYCAISSASLMRQLTRLINEERN